MTPLSRPHPHQLPIWISPLPPPCLLPLLAPRFKWPTSPAKQPDLLPTQVCGVSVGAMCGAQEFTTIKSFGKYSRSVHTRSWVSFFRRDFLPFILSLFYSFIRSLFLSFVRSLFLSFFHSFFLFSLSVSFGLKRGV